MSLRRCHQCLGAKLPNQGIISTAGGEHVPSLTVEDTLEKNAAFEKLIVQAAERIYESFPLHLEPFQVRHECIQPREDRSQPFRKFGAFHNRSQSLISLSRRV